MPSNDPASVDISKSKGVAIVWSDGHRSEYTLKYLRDHCPCATCTTKAQAPPPGPANPLPLYKPPLRIQDVESTGRYGLRFYWNDGHGTGIYSFDRLRALCPCPECNEELRTKKFKGDARGT